MMAGSYRKPAHIDWDEDSITSGGDTLFPGEDTTKGSHYIHAWSYEKAGEYLKVLLDAK